MRIVDQEQRVAIGLRVDDHFGANIPARARSVLDDKWLAETL